jgi:hypothetical protein
MKRVGRILMAMIAALALMSGVASAKKTGSPTYVPPNQSAASQYTEDVPTAGGNAPTSGVGGSGPGSGSGAGSIPAKTLHQLNHSGSAGAAAASLARSLSPATHTTPAKHTPTATPAASTTPKAHVGAPAAQVIKTLGGSDAGGGIGILLPAILVLSLIGATGLGLLRIRNPA